ncbi:MAG: GNVR domain-containing protein, partial [Bacteroidota bacterium]
MNSSGNIMRIIRPFIKAWPIIFLFLVGGVSLGFVNIYYAVPTYQTFSILQINDKESGASTFLKKFETFSVIGQLLTEVEVLRSKYLIHKTLEKMDIQTSHFRYYRSKPRNLYKQSPFEIDYTFHDSSFYNRHFQFMLKAEEELELSYMANPDKEIKISGKVGERIMGEGFELVIGKNMPYLKAHPDAFKTDHYGFTVHSKRSLVDKYSNKDLVVSLPDENVSIVKLFFTSEVPELAADFVNTLAETYIEDFVDSKSGTASKALNFIDEQIEKVEKELQTAEDTLAKYKVKTQVVDLAMETDAKLKRIGELEIRKLTLELEQTELQDLLSFLNTDTITYELNPNYESIEDPAFTDAILKLNTFKSSKKELLQQYTNQHPEIIKINDELNRTRSFLVNSVQNTLSTNQAKIKSLSDNITEVNSNFAKLPGIERDIMMLKRRFATQEQVYAFLLEKRAEAAIGAASTISFHKILERAPIPKNALTPQKSLILGLSGFVGIILSVLLVFLYNYMRATVYYPADIELSTEVPLLSQINKLPKNLHKPSQDFINLATHMHLIKDTHRISISTYGPKEGKDELSLYLAQALAAIGYKTLLIDLDLYQPFLSGSFELDDSRGISQAIQQKESLYDCIQASPIPGLDLLPSGEVTTHIPTALILNPALERILENLSREYERIVIRSPYLKEVRDSIP